MCPPTASSGDIAIYPLPSRIARRMRIFLCCTLASALLALGAAIFFRLGLVLAIPLLAASGTLYGGAVLQSQTQAKPSVLLTSEGIWIRSCVNKVLPWQTIKSVARYRPYGSTSSKLALSFNHDRIRPALPRGNSRDVPEALLDVTLDTADYDIDPDELEQALRERISDAAARPWNRGLLIVDVSSSQESAMIAFLMLLPFLAFLAFGIRTMRSATFRSTIAAPDYPHDRAARLASASRDIVRFPRDTRVRMAYASVLFRRGQHLAAEQELTKALADTEAIAAMDALETSRYRGVGMDLEEKVKMDLALLLADEGKTLQAKQTMFEVCPDVSNADMPMLTKLDLCHYSRR